MTSQMNGDRLYNCQVSTVFKTCEAKFLKMIGNCILHQMGYFGSFPKTATNPTTAL